MSSYFFRTLMIKAYSSQLIFELIKVLEIKTSILFNLNFAKNTIFCDFSLFLIIYLYFLLPAFIAHIFNPTAELVIPIGMPSKEAKAEIQIHSIIVENKIRKCSI